MKFPFPVIRNFDKLLCDNIAMAFRSVFLERYPKIKSVWASLPTPVYKVKPGKKGAMHIDALVPKS
jgi:hypothetical protein